VDMTHTVNNPSVATAASPNADLTPDGTGGFSLTSDAQPYWDDCSTRDAVAMSGKNIGDELNARHVSWGWFQGGFRPTTSFTDAAAATGNAGQPTSTFIPDEFKGKFFQNVPHASDQGICNANTAVGAGLTSPLPTGTGQFGFKDDYIPHHEPFEYYASTANPHHLTVPADSSGQDTLRGLRSIGTDTQHFVKGQPQFDTPNHQYDMSDFDQLVSAIHLHLLPASALPSVSFLKAPGFQDGHAAYSDPLDEQEFLVKEINALEQTDAWPSTAVIIAYDDSDGWYDHAFSGVTNPSTSVADALTGTGMCGTGTPLAGQQGRCGYGPRQPFLLLSPWSKRNAVDSTLTDQSSITRFIEDNWLHGQRISGSGRRPGRLAARPVRFPAARLPAAVPQPRYRPARALVIPRGRTPRRASTRGARPADPDRRAGTFACSGAVCHQPRAIHAPRCGRSASTVVLRPWPGWMRVGPGKRSSPRTDSMMAGKSDSGGPVSPGPPGNRVSPVSRCPSTDRVSPPGVCPGVCSTRTASGPIWSTWPPAAGSVTPSHSGPPGGKASASGSRASRSSVAVPAFQWPAWRAAASSCGHTGASAGWASTGTPSARATRGTASTWSKCAWVSSTASTSRSAAAARMRSGSSPGSTISARRSPAACSTQQLVSSTPTTTRRSTARALTPRQRA